MSLEGESHEVEVTSNMELLVTFGMSLEGESHEVEVTTNMELLVTFGMSWRGFVMSFIHDFTTSSYLIWR
jgi:hypothetical protein